MEAERHHAGAVRRLLAGCARAGLRPAARPVSSTGNSTWPTTRAALFPAVEGVDCSTADEDQFDGIAELTFRSVADRQTWIDRVQHPDGRRAQHLPQGDRLRHRPGKLPDLCRRHRGRRPERRLGAVKFHVLVRQADQVGHRRFPPVHDRPVRRPGRAEAPRCSSSGCTCSSRRTSPAPMRPASCTPSRPRSSITRPSRSASASPWTWRRSSPRRHTPPRSEDQAKFVQQVAPFPERNVYTFVYDGQMTLAGQRGSRHRRADHRIGALNQLRDDILDLVLGKGVR